MSTQNKTLRVYNGADASMLTALAVIMGTATTPTIKTFLLSKRSNWADPHFKSLTDDINDAFKNVLGVKSKTDQVKATKELYAAVEAVIPKLRSFKEQVEVDFEDDNREKQILNSLGFALWAKVQKGSQEALVELLATFNENMNSTLQKEITDAGTDVTYITDISKYADIVKDANIKQEGLKNNSKTVTADGIVELNKVYNNVMKVAKIAASLYTEIGDTTTAEKFNYSKALAALGTAKKVKKVATPEEAKK